jgi:hypothetical protein
MTEQGHEDEIEPSEEDIRERAYQIYLARGGKSGLDEQDWMQAEAELKEEARKPN